MILLLTSALGLAGAPPGLDFPSAPPPDWAECPLVAVEIAMAGDVMMHGMQVAAARRSDGSYSLDGVFDGVAPWLKAADLAITNLETVIGGESLGGYTGFPRFNSPDALLDALVDAGIDILQTANNHSLDRDELGVLRTLDAIDARGLARAGTFRSLEERLKPWVRVELPGGLSVAFLAATYGTNGIPLPADKPWLVSLLHDGWLESDIAAARADADLVIVGVHWGEEYKHQPEPHMVALARRLVDAGADVVMGTHPHVLQPAEVLAATDALGRPRDALVLYSLGNFVSNQRLPFRHGAAIARLTVLRCEALDRSWLADVRFTPFWVDDRLADRTLAYRVLPVPPFGVETCDDPDLDARDCAAMLRFRAHAAEIFPPAHLDWSHRRSRAVAAGFDWSGRGGFRDFAWWPAPDGVQAGTVALGESHTDGIQ